MKRPLKTFSQRDVLKTPEQHPGFLPGLEPLATPHPLEVERTVFSFDSRYRYTLFRYFPESPASDPDLYCAFIGMNPSGADLYHDDRTVCRCMAFARSWGFSAMYMLNAFALRATNPKELVETNDPIGPDNDSWIMRICSEASLIVVAWGNPGKEIQDRQTQMERVLWPFRSRVMCFGKNKSGAPIHPLYQPANAPLIPFFTSD